MQDKNEIIETEELKNETEGEENENENLQEGQETSEEIVVSIVGEKAEEVDETKAPEWVRDLRKSHRELQKNNRELQEKLAASQPEQRSVSLGVKPTLEACDYDADKFETELLSWQAKKQETESAENRRKAEIQAINEAWQATLQTYGTSKKELKVKDFDEAEDLIKDTLSVVQQGIVLQGCDNSALVVYALGKNPKKAKELAAIFDPVKFAFAISKLENQLKVTNRKTPPPPEKEVSRGSAAISGSVDSTLERLRRDSEKTGDMSKVLAYKKQLKSKQK
jgi:hypothetical protein